MSYLPMSLFWAGLLMETQCSSSTKSPAAEVASPGNLDSRRESRSIEKTYWR